MIDTHCHLTFDALADDVSTIVDRARAVGVRGMITVATTSDDARRSQRVAEQFDGVWCSAGVHPLYSDRPVDWDVIRKVAKTDSCVAWGELGLDNHYDTPPRDVQQRVLEEQLDVIAEARSDGLAKPIIVHCRKAVDDLLPVFGASALPPDRFVFHCFSESPDDARRVLDFGSWISFTGIVTFANARDVAEAAHLVPLDRLMVETDSPFLSPEPKRKIWPNEPANVIHIARFLAAQRDMSYEDFERQMDANAERFFGISLPAATPE